MISISDEQMAAFSRAAELNFVNRLARHLADLTGAELDASEANAISICDEARKFGFLTELQISRFAEIKLARLQFSASDALPLNVKRNLSDPDIIYGDRLDKFQIWADSKARSIYKPYKGATIFLNQEIGSVVQSCLREPKAAGHWIEIELVDENGNLIPDIDVEICLPDGAEVKAKLDHKGFVRISGITVSGKCIVRFPEIDVEYITKVAELPGRTY